MNIDDWKKKELEKMSKQLKLLQKKLQEKYLIIQKSYYDYINDNRRSK